MARFGSFAGGLSAGLSAGLDRQGADMDRQQKGLLQRYQMTQNKLKEAGDIILKFKTAGKEVPPEMVQLVQTLAKQADEAGIALGQPEAGMNSHVMEGLLASPGAAKAFSVKRIRNVATGQIKSVQESDLPKYFSKGRPAMDTDASGEQMLPRDFVGGWELLDDTAPETPAPKDERTTKMKDAEALAHNTGISVKEAYNRLFPAEKGTKPTKFWVSLLDENGKVTGKRRKITDDEYDPALHTDIKIDKDNLPSLRTKIIKTDDGRLAEQKEQLTGDAYVAYGVAKPIEELPYTYEKLTNRAGHYLRINPNNNSRDVVDLSDLSADEQSRITAQQARADLAAGVSDLEGIASARAKLQEARTISEQTGQPLRDILIEGNLIPKPDDQLSNQLLVMSGLAAGLSEEDMLNILQTPGGLNEDQVTQLNAWLEKYRNTRMSLFGAIPTSTSASSTSSSSGNTTSGSQTTSGGTTYTIVP
mgnify:CR=1 FL=1|tara:strand:- start:4001 stop:5425 length:1425 start_codon:yes stop_codon:yes gene_type:complete